LYEKLAAMVFGSKFLDGKWSRYLRSKLTAYYDEKILEELLKENFGEELIPTYGKSIKLRVSTFPA
jgi:hypothetical protein